MERAVVQQAVEQLQRQGTPLQEISAPKVREILGAGSYRDITKHLRELKGEDPSGREADDAAAAPSVDRPPVENASALEPQGPEEFSSSGEENPKGVADAEQALSHAREQVQEAEAQIPALEDALAEARQQVLAATGEVLAAAAALKQGWLSGDDPAPAASEAEAKAAAAVYQGARWHLQQAQQRVTSWRQRVHEAEQRLGEARRHAWLAAHRPELLERQGALAEDPRQTNGWRGDYFRLKYERQTLQAEIEAVCAEAGV